MLECFLVQNFRFITLEAKVMIISANGSYNHEYKQVAFFLCGADRTIDSQSIDEEDDYKNEHTILTDILDSIASQAIDIPQLHYHLLNQDLFLLFDDDSFHQLISTSLTSADEKIFNFLIYHGFPWHQYIHHSSHLNLQKYVFDLNLIKESKTIYKDISDILHIRSQFDVHLDFLDNKLQHFHALLQEAANLYIYDGNLIIEDQNSNLSQICNLNLSDLKAHIEKVKADITTKVISYDNIDPNLENHNFINYINQYVTDYNFQAILQSNLEYYFSLDISKELSEKIYNQLNIKKISILK